MDDGGKMGANGPHQWIPGHFLGGVTCQCFFMGGLLLFFIFFLIFLIFFKKNIQFSIKSFNKKVYYLFFKFRFHFFEINLETPIFRYFDNIIC